MGCHHEQRETANVLSPSPRLLSHDASVCCHVDIMFTCERTNAQRYCLRCPYAAHQDERFARLFAAAYMPDAAPREQPSCPLFTHASPERFGSPREESSAAR